MGSNSEIQELKIDLAELRRQLVFTRRMVLWLSVALAIVVVSVFSVAETIGAIIGVLLIAVLLSPLVAIVWGLRMSARAESERCNRPLHAKLVSPTSECWSVKKFYALDLARRLVCFAPQR